jgi:hypothetical protein
MLILLKMGIKYNLISGVFASLNSYNGSLLRSSFLFLASVLTSRCHLLSSSEDT